MTDRKEFEAWVKSKGYLIDEDDFDVWQASRKQALEEAAKICDDVLECPSLGARHCAEYIRSMK